MTGSFEPVIDANWERDAYASGEAQRADPRLLSRNDDTKNTQPHPSLGFAPLTTSTTTSNSTSTKAATTSFGANNAALKKQKKLKAMAKKKPAKTAKRPKDEDEDEEDEDELQEEEDEEEKAPKKSSSPKRVTFAPSSSSSFAAAHAPVPSRTAGGYASTTYSPSLSSFGGPSIAPVASTPPRPSSNAYTMSNFGGYSNSGATPASFSNAPSSTTSAFIDTPSKGLAALGPQPGASFGFTTAATPGQSFGFGVPTSPSPNISSVHQHQHQQQHQPPLSSIPPSSSVGAFSSPTSRALLLLALFAKQGKLSSAEKGALKERVLRSDVLVNAAMEVFEIDQDLDELCDTLKRIAALL